MERKFQLLPGMVQVFLENGQAPADIVPVLSAAASFARGKRLRDLVVVSGLDDPATPEAVCMALEEIAALGAPSFRIAFVACTLSQYSVYHFAERYAQRFGITVKVLAAVCDAKDWLGVQEGALCLSAATNQIPIGTLTDRALRRSRVEVRP